MMTDDPGLSPRPRLLIADDDPEDRLTLVEQLSGRVQVVGVAADAEEAIELAASRQPEIALIDAHMPGGAACTPPARSRAVARR